MFNLNVSSCTHSSNKVTNVNDCKQNKLNASLHQPNFISVKWHTMHMTTNSTSNNNFQYKEIL